MNTSMNVTPRRRLVWVAALGIFSSALGCSSPSEQADTTGAGDAGDAVDVPMEGLLDAPDDEYVVVPNGRLHRSCVFDVGHGAHLTESATAAPCRYRSKPGSGTTNAQPDTNDWVEAERMVATKNGVGIDWFNELDGRWTVPPAPLRSGGQSVFLFTGLTSTVDSRVLLQPVLAYGHIGNPDESIGGGNFWSTELWMMKDGNGYHSSPGLVNPGDTIRTYMHVTNCAPSGACIWQLSIFVDRPNGTRDPSDYIVVEPGAKMDIAWKGVLELKGLSACNQLPSTRFVDFRQVGINMPQSMDSLVYPGMIMWPEPTPTDPTPGRMYWPVSPSCGYAITDLANDSVRLGFTP